jgi:hypothetical protein
LPAEPLEKLVTEQLLEVLRRPALVPLKLTPFQLALVRAHRWLQMLESGAVASMKELAEQERVDPSLVSRPLNLTTLAPAIVQAILDDTLPRHLTLFDIGIDPPLSWEQQREALH